MNAPAWGYRRGKDGEVEARIFEDGKLPQGWLDTPAKFRKRRGGHDDSEADG